MRIAITGGTGFVGRHLARTLVARGHDVVLIARGEDRRDESVRRLHSTRFLPIGTADPTRLSQALAGCEAVAHCSGINRELGEQTYERVHVLGTRNVVEAAQRAGVQRIALLSFLRARPDCGSRYHESKWAAEEIVRGSGLDYSIIKAGVIYGRGDHMLDHLSHAFHTFPVFAFVGFRDTPMRPMAVEDLVRILVGALVERRLPCRTVFALGPEEITCRDAVRRVARVVGRRPLMFPMPLAFHYAFAWFTERAMTIPLVSIAQVRILAEGLVEPLPFADALPPDLTPQTRFTDEQIRKGLPLPASFGPRDCRFLRSVAGLHPIEQLDGSRLLSQRVSAMVKSY